MPRYYFDSHDDQDHVADNVGVELADIEAAKLEAARGIADIAKDVLPSTVRRSFSINVRDEQNRILVRTVLLFDVFDINPPPELQTGP